MTDHDHSEGVECLGCEAEANGKSRAEWLPDYIESTKRMIADKGFVDQGVGGGDGLTNWNYSIGFHYLGSPDVAIVGLPPQNAHELMWNLFWHIKNTGPLTEGILDDIIKGYPAKLRHCPNDDPFFPFAQANNVYETAAFETMQLLWPDSDGKFPDEEGYDYAPDVQPFIGGK